MNKKGHITIKSVDKHDSLSNSATIKSSVYLCVCLALVAIYGIWRYFSAKGQSFGSLLVLPVFLVYRSVYQSILSEIFQKTISRQRKFFLLTGGLTLLFSLCMTWGGMLDINSCFSPAWDCAVMAFGLFFALYPCIWFVTRKLDDFAGDIPSQSVVPANPRLIRNTKRNCFFAIVVIWLLIYLGMYPGLYGYDAPYLMRQQMDDTIAVIIYPAYSTVLYKLFSLGLSLGGSNESGLAFAMALQGMLSIFGIWRVLCFIETYMRSKKAIVFAALFYMLLPTHAILSFSSTIDAPFVVFFSMCVIHSIRIVLDWDAYWKAPKNWLSFGGWMVLLCLTRLNGIYVLLVFAVLIPFYPQKTRIKTTMIFLSAALTFQTCQRAINNYYGVTRETSAISSMLSIPVQQIGRVHENAYDKLSEEEWSVVYRYIPSDMLYIYNYQPCISDVLMRAKNEELLIQDPGTFLKMYVTVLTRAPAECLQAGLLSCVGLWYPDKYYSDWRMYHPFIEYQMFTDDSGYRPEFLAIHRQSKLPFVDKLLSELYGEVRAEGVPVAFDDIPIFSVFTRIGLYFFAAVYAFFYLLYRRRFCFLPCIGLVLGVVICVILGPVTFYRYCAPMIFSAPAWIAVLFISPPELDVPVRIHSKTKSCSGEQKM